MARYYSSKSFKAKCGYAYNMESYAEMNISKSEKLDLTYATQDPEDPDIYIAEYGVLDWYGNALYSLTVKYKASTNEYSCQKSS